MKFVLIAIFFLLINQSAFPNSSSLLNELDKVLAKKEAYTQERLKRIQQLKEKISNRSISSLGRYNTYLQIFDEYKTINFDSALTYVNHLERAAIKLEDQEKISLSKINLAFILLSSGMFKETKEALEKINISSLASSEKVMFFTLKSRYYYDLCDFVKNNQYCAGYVSKGNIMADSVMALSSPNSYSYLFVSGLKNLRNGNLDAAVKDYSQIINNPKLTEHQYAVVASTMSYLHGRKNQNSKAFDLLVRAAIADIKSSTKENVAMFRLADTLFRAGNNERAYKYIREAMSDAEFYGARHRQFEVGTLLPIIEGKQLMLVEKQKTMISTYAVIVTVLILVIVAFIIFVIRQNKKLQLAQASLSIANVNLHQINSTLTEVNSALREANRIKDEYIGYYFNINSDYVDKIERFKKSISQRLTLGRYEEIKQIINKVDLKKEREELSIGFDRVFIKLFPNFVEEFNSLLPENDRISLPNGQILNTELRIFALIRLGIHDNDKIAKILNFSVNTIYSYKTRIKNKSFILNDEFEKRILAIKV